MLKSKGKLFDYIRELGFSDKDMVEVTYFGNKYRGHIYVEPNHIVIYNDNIKIRHGFPILWVKNGEIRLEKI